jgi:hypothetical protein
LRGIVRTERGMLPIVDPASFFSHAQLSRLNDALVQIDTLGDKAQ